MIFASGPNAALFTIRQANHTMKDFFISYSSRDEAQAEWLANILEDAGYSVLYMGRDFPAGSSFPALMATSSEQTHRTIAIITADSLNSDHCRQEWNTRLAMDPVGRESRLIPILCAQVDLPPTLAQFRCIHIHGLKPSQASNRIISEIQKLAPNSESPPIPEPPARDRHCILRLLLSSLGLSTFLLLLPELPGYTYLAQSESVVWTLFILFWTVGLALFLFYIPIPLKSRRAVLLMPATLPFLTCPYFVVRHSLQNSTETLVNATSNAGFSIFRHQDPASNGFRAHYKGHTQTWTTAQCISALAPITTNTMFQSAVEAAMDFCEKRRIETDTFSGWSLERPGTENRPIVETAAWVILARAAVLQHRPGQSSIQNKRLLHRDVKELCAAIGPRSHAWSSFPEYSDSDPRVYPTALAALALARILELQLIDKNSPDNLYLTAKNTLTESIDWLLRSYNQERKEWLPNPSRHYPDHWTFQGLQGQCLHTLYAAASVVPFLDGNHDWVSIRMSFAAADFGQLASTSDLLYDENDQSDTLIDGKVAFGQETRCLRWPWIIASLTSLQDDPVINLSQRLKVRRDLLRLLQPELVASVYSTYENFGAWAVSEFIIGARHAIDPPSTAP
jgi:hypothetical protein